MDPEANKAEQRQILQRRKEGQVQRGDSGRLKELQTALREWKNKGGFNADTTRT